ncbi:MAG: histidine--tRNA ligase, partial [Myxococcales bacterium]|nr:histidine--tRNA ligase [Myxococcales bacterium]
MARIEPRILKGFRDYLPGQMIPRERMLDTVKRVFERYGFAPLATPALEYSEILLGKYGEEGEKLLYRFRDNGDRDVSLRYDLTVPLARVIGQYGELDKPLKRYQIAPVWRAEKPARGRFREFVQCDIDIVGVESMLADAECVLVGCDVLEALGVSRFEIRINNRKILDALMATLGVEQHERKMAILRSVDKLPKIGEAAVRQLLVEQDGLSAASAETVCRFVAATDREALGAVRELVGDHRAGQAGLEELGQLLSVIDAAGRTSEVKLDLSIARGLDYYTGTIYETFLLDLPDFGSVMSGGRYDTLMQMFSGQSHPAVGISLGVDRLFAGLSELGLVREEASATQVLIALFDDGDLFVGDSLAYALRVAGELRRAGIATELPLAAGKLKKQFKYADRRAIPFVVIAGPDERAAELVTVKDLRHGSQESIPRAEL